MPVQVSNGVTLDHADPYHRHPGEINHNYAGRGVYFSDPDGHNMELMTAPYGTIPAH